MRNIRNKADCTGCGACAAACAKKCITMQADGEGFLYPSADAAMCTDCRACEKACPMEKERDAAPSEAYAAQNTDEEARLQSSSGGIFSLLAEAVIARGGTVFGAAMTDALHVRHIGIDKTEDIPRLRGSKYVQSDTAAAYAEAKKLLQAGKTVLFTGTPCEIAGLKSCLPREYEALYTQDIVCHGVPSPGLWSAYAAAKPKADTVQFRDKSTGWKSYSVTFADEDRTVYKKEYSGDEYMMAFLRNFSLRPACYHCRSKGENAASDLTLGDFWGVESVCPELSDDKGTSLLLVHTDKGRELLGAIEAKARIKPVPLEEALRHNPSAVSASPCPPEREKFMDELREAENVCPVLKKYGMRSFSEKLRRKLKHMLGA